MVFFFFFAVSKVMSSHERIDSVYRRFKRGIELLAKIKSTGTGTGVYFFGDLVSLKASNVGFPR